VRTESEWSPFTAFGHRALAASRLLAGIVISVPPYFGSLPLLTSIHFVPLRLISNLRHAVSLEISWRFVFELRDCRPSGRLRARRTTLIWFDPSFERGISDAPSRLVIVGRVAMKNPTTWRYFRLSSPALDRTE
jgi:hypothetical protein